MKTLTIANQKGGVGKTTLTCLMGFWLADKQNARVALIDIDSQRNLTHTMRRHDVGIASTALFSDTELSLPAVRQRISLFHATTELANLELGTAQQASLRVRTFAAQIERLAPEFDYCLVDPPPTLGIRMIAALGAADYVSAPIELEEYSTEGVKDMLRAIFGTRQQRNPRLKFIGILPNRFTHNSVRQKAALEELLTRYSELVMPAKISTRAAIPRALEAGVPVWELATSAAREASAEVLKVCELMHQRMHAVEDVAAEAKP